jgi:hypothetical protein
MILFPSLIGWQTIGFFSRRCSPLAAILLKVRSSGRSLFLENDYPDKKACFFNPLSDNSAAAVANQGSMRVRFVSIIATVIAKINLQYFTLFLQKGEGFIDHRKADRRELLSNTFIKLRGTGMPF